MVYEDTIPDDIKPVLDTMLENITHLYFGVGDKGEVANLDLYYDRPEGELYRDSLDKLLDYKREILRNLYGASHELNRFWNVRYTLPKQHTPLHHHGDDGDVVFCLYKSNKEVNQPIMIANTSYYPGDYTYLIHDSKTVHKYYHNNNSERNCFVTIWSKDVS